MAFVAAAAHHHRLDGNESVVVFEDSRCEFRVPSRYLVQELLGVGSFGVVAAGRDNGELVPVAIKKVTGALESPQEIQRLLREICLLHHFSHENIIDVKDIFLSSKNDVYLVSTLMATDLKKIIESSQPLSYDHCQYFAYQLCCGLHYVHSANVIHRDLKPANLLVNADATLRIADFGSARADDVSVSSDALHTQYVVTRWYRAPEVILSWGHYTKSIDIWAVGCIVAELFRRRPLFSGSTHLQHVARIFDTLGTPEPELTARIAIPDAQPFLQALPQRARRSVAESLSVGPSNAPSEADARAIHFMDAVLQIDPVLRLSARDCLRHPFFADCYDPGDERVCPEAFKDWFVANQDPNLTQCLQKIRELAHYYDHKRN